MLEVLDKLMDCSEGRHLGEAVFACEDVDVTNARETITMNHPIDTNPSTFRSNFIVNILSDICRSHQPKKCCEFVFGQYAVVPNQGLGGRG